MSSLLLLLASALLPWIICPTFRAIFALDDSAPVAIQERALGHYQRATLFMTLVVLPSAAVAGALLADPSLSTRWPTAGAWFFASLNTVTMWVSLAVARRTREEASAMPNLETAGRAVQMAAVPVLAVGLSLLAGHAVESLLPIGTLPQAIVTALLSVAAVIVVSPWLVMVLGLWPLLSKRIEADGISWRLAHLPAPSPFLTHAAALPWLRTALVSDGLFKRAPERHWETLVRYEVGGAMISRRDRLARWAIAIPLSLLVFLGAQSVGEAQSGKLVAATFLAVVFTATATWFANRRPSSGLRLDLEGPSVQELAQTLRSLPPCLGQALPRTWHKPLGSAVYDRLFALGHDPGRRPHT